MHGRIADAVDERGEGVKGGRVTVQWMNRRCRGGNSLPGRARHNEDHRFQRLGTVVFIDQDSRVPLELEDEDGDLEDERGVE